MDLGGSFHHGKAGRKVSGDSVRMRGNEEVRASIHSRVRASQKNEKE